MNNLIGNALKYTDAGSVEIIATFDSDRAMLRIEVIDSGIGIAEQFQQELFQPFVQGDSAFSRKHEGSGLGLNICRKLVELMGGQIGVSSRLGDGSTFWFELPAPACQAPDDDSRPISSTRRFHRFVSSWLKTMGRRSGLSKLS